MWKVVTMAAITLVPMTGWAQELDLKALSGEKWYGVYMNDHKSGFMCTSLSVDGDGVVTIASDATFRLSQAGKRQEMRVSEKRRYAKDGLLDYTSSDMMDANGLEKHFSLRRTNGGMLFTTKVGQITERMMPAAKETLNDFLDKQRLVARRAKPGEKIQSSRFEAMLGLEMASETSVLKTETRILDGVTTKVYEIETLTTFPGGPMRSVSYLTEDGTILEDNVAGSMTLRLESEVIARNVDYSNDVIVSNAAMVDAPIADARTRPELRLFISGPLDPAQIIQEDRQSFTPTDGGYLFTGRKLGPEGAPSAVIPVADPAMAEWIKPTTLLQSDNPKIIAKAQEIVGSEKDAFKASGLLCDWVYKNVRTTYSASLSNALESLESLQGDCTEHSMLFIGLARALGLPARETAGLIYVATPEPGFYFHQWATVWVGRWIDVDPTFNQPIADATHVKLAEGDLLAQAQLMPLIGRLKVKAVEDADVPAPPAG